MRVSRPRSRNPMTTTLIKRIPSAPAPTFGVGLRPCLSLSFRGFMSFKPTPPPDGPVSITGISGEQLRLAFSSTEPQPDRGARMNGSRTWPMTWRVRLGGAASEYKAVAAEAEAVSREAQGRSGNRRSPQG